MNKLFFGIGTVLLMLSVSASAETYRSVDKDGNVTYSDRASKGSEQVKVKVPGQSAASDAAKQEAAAEAAAQPGNGETQVAEDAQCEQAKKQLEVYEKSDTLVQTDEFGSKREVTGDERVDAIMRGRQAVKKYCLAAYN